MKRLLTFLITGYWNEPKKHEHEWETIETTPVHERQDDGPLGVMSTHVLYKRYVLRCKTCGDIKIVNGHGY